MQKFNAYICRFGAIAMGLISLNANAQAILVDVRSVDPTITVDLRYAGRHNFLKHSLYPRGTHALARPEVVSGLAAAQSILRRYQYGLKIWDAYRPVAVQAMLWQASHNDDYVANPDVGAGSLHSWGIAVDATMVDSRTRDVRMPTDFDDFTPASMLPYMGSSPEIRSNLRLLRYAMHKAGFCGLRTEWWHYTILQWQKYVPPEKAKATAQLLKTHSEGEM
jgi:D-alanyl-D-alanine dipeptidase